MDLSNITFYNNIYFISEFIATLQKWIRGGRGAGAQGAIVYAAGFWVRSQIEEMKYLFKFIFPFLRPPVEAKHGVEIATLHAMPPEFGG